MDIKDKIANISEELTSEIGGKTSVNYMPVRDTLLLKCEVNLPSMDVVRATSVRDLLEAADLRFKDTLTPQMKLRVAAISKDLCESYDLPLGAIVDVKTLNSVVYKPFVYDEVNIMVFLKKFKEQHKDIYSAVSHVSNQKVSKTLGMSSLIGLDNNPLITGLDGSVTPKVALLKDDIIELSFYVVTEFHNISGIYKEL